jgi:hypothetical protein
VIRSIVVAVAISVAVAVAIAVWLSPYPVIVRLAFRCGFPVLVAFPLSRCRGFPVIPLLSGWRSAVDFPFW